MLSTTQKPTRRTRRNHMAATATPTLEYAIASQERVLTALRQSQTAVVDVVGTWAKAVENATPDLPAIPVAAALPSLEELIANSYEFAGKMLEAQRQFASELVAAASPAVKTTPVELPKA
jgi:alpha-D-ribose 1-methylphosphonate 5-triphosphate synthase subunit PhnH